MAGEVQDRYGASQILFLGEARRPTTASTSRKSAASTAKRARSNTGTATVRFYRSRCPASAGRQCDDAQGIFVTDSKLFSWYSEIKMNTIKRRTVVIKPARRARQPENGVTLTMLGRQGHGTDLKSKAMKSRSSQSRSPTTLTSRRRNRS